MFDGDAGCDSDNEHDDQLDVGFGLDDLAALLSDAVSLDETLRRIAEYAFVAFPAVNGSVVRLGDGTATVVAGVPAARIADELHDTLGEGPMLDAIASATVVSSGSLAGSQRWRRFGPRAGRLGLHSVLCVPLVLNDTIVATVTTYSSHQDAFTQLDADTAQYYAAPTAAVLHNARVLEQSTRRIAELTEAIRVRPDIDRAVGIMMSRTGKSADEALTALRRMSNVRHIKVADLAHQIVDEARRRARRVTA